MGVDRRDQQVRGRRLLGLATSAHAPLALWVAALLTVGTLAGLGTSLHDSQAKARQGIQSRFAERATLSAALTESLFASSASIGQARSAQRFGAPHVATARLREDAVRGRLVSLVLLRADGAIIGRSPGTPAAIARVIAAKPPFVRAALRGQSFAMSDVIAGPRGKDTIQFAQSFATPAGRRVLVSGLAPRLLYRFMSGYLAAIPKMAGGHAYVLDGRTIVVGGASAAAGLGRVVTERGLAAAVRHGAQGRFEDGRYFASGRVRNSHWHVVLTAPASVLFAPVTGADRWVPWLLFAGFGLVATMALVLVTRLVRRAAQLRVSEERYALAAQGANDGIWDRDFANGRVYLSPRWKEMLGHAPEEIADTVEEWTSRMHPDDVGGLQAALDVHLRGETSSFAREHRMLHSDGTYHWFITRGVATRGRDGAPRRVAGSTSDISERKAAEELLRRSALHDALTGLPNRALFLERLTASLQRTTLEPAHRCAVMFLDLDRFKRINDSFSHAVGDELLVALGRRLSDILRPGDTIARGGAEGFVARFGGDEFTILLENLDAPAGAQAVAARIQADLQEPFRIWDRELFVSASIGIAIGEAGATALELMRNADIAMYDAKRKGPAHFSVFTKAMHRRVRDQIELETALRGLLEERRLRVFYQPVVHLPSGKLTGFEALARWPEGPGEIDPARFVACAEDTGLIADLGRIVLEQACDRLVDWRARGIVGPETTVSVNVSARQLVDPRRLVADVEDALRRSGLPPRCLRLEITESTVISRPERARLALEELARLGVRAEIDDFGTGYASLTVLQSFAGDTLKIDRSFITTMHVNEGHEAIVRGIVALAHNLGIGVIAEGIEHPAQLALLRSVGCEYGQGYLFARPMDAARLEPAIIAWDAVAWAGAETCLTPHAALPPRA